MFSTLLFKKKFLVLIAACTLVVTIVHAQHLPAPDQKKIDSLFSNWNSTSSPGCTIGIVRNDSLIYAKGYGMSNLEYGIINTPETIFHMASVSKQFTAYAILLLAGQGKLNLDDDIRKYLNWFPDLKEKITVRNLLNHTSGIRDQWELLAIAGTRIEDVITQQQIVKILSKQQDLNFKPGSEFLYSNSNFTLLAEIVKSVSGKTLRQFTDSLIFKPLGMASTHFHDDYTEIEKNRAYSYERKDAGGFVNSPLNYSNAGATSLFTNINDMSKWVMNFYHTRAGNSGTIARLVQKGKLTSGKEIDYALGISVDDYNGSKRYSHNGADAGYRTAVAIFPDQKMGFIVFSNLGDFDPSEKINELADLFIMDKTEKPSKPAVATKDSILAVLKDTTSIKKFLGSYINNEGTAFNFLLRNRKLYLKDGSLLMPAGINAFTFEAGSSTAKFVFAEGVNKKPVVTVTYKTNKWELHQYYAAEHYSDKQLAAYTGSYYSPELDCKYGIVLKDHHLVLTSSKYDDAKLTLAGSDQMTNDNWWMGNLLVTRKGKKITGFEINSSRVRHLKFRKI